MAPLPKITATETEMRRWKSQGITHKELAAKYDVTVGAITKHLAKLELSKERPRYENTIPWAVALEHQASPAAWRLRLLGHRLENIENGKDPDAGINPRKLGMLNKFVEDLGPRGPGGFVMNYDPDCPPNPASWVGGFFCEPWRRSDGQGYVRMPKMQKNPRTGQRQAAR